MFASAARAEEAPPVYFSPKQGWLRFRNDGLAREEWTQNVFAAPGSFHDDRRWRLRWRGRLETTGDRFRVGIGLDANRGEDRNTPSTLVRDNYKSRDLRLDLAFARWQLSSGFRLEGGRFPMPLEVTEMLWDRDLRAQGVAVRLAAREAGGAEPGGVERFHLDLVFSDGSHVFKDNGVRLAALSSGATFVTSGHTKIDAVGSLLLFSGLRHLDPMIRRQNTRLSGAPAPLAFSYHVADFLLRLRIDGGIPFQIVADDCWNTGAKGSNEGIWLAATLGSLHSNRVQVDYTYARVDKDATLAAYATDDFFWATGWTGQRADLGIGMGRHLSFHVVGQKQRFKDSPRVEERDHSVDRLRVELRTPR